jgi:hypothetical protein
MASLLLKEVADADLLLDERAQAHVLIYEKEDGRSALMRLRGRPFRLWLTRRGFAATGEVPGSGVLSAVLHLLEAQAQEGRRLVLWNRVARGPDRALWLDLADGSGRAVRVTAEGFGVVAGPPPLFHCFSHQQPRGCGCGCA